MDTNIALENLQKSLQNNQIEKCSSILLEALNNDYFKRT